MKMMFFGEYTITERFVRHTDGTTIPIMGFVESLDVACYAPYEDVVECYLPIEGGDETYALMVYEDGKAWIEVYSTKEEEAVYAFVTDTGGGRPSWEHLADEDSPNPDDYQTEFHALVAFWKWYNGPTKNEEV